MVEKTIANIVGELKKHDFIKGIVLGGSRATGTATENSDIDIGIYCFAFRMAFNAANRFSRKAFSSAWASAFRSSEKNSSSAD